MYTYDSCHANAILICPAKEQSHLSTVSWRGYINVQMIKIKLSVYTFKIMWISILPQVVLILLMVISIAENNHCGLQNKMICKLKFTRERYGTKWRKACESFSLIFTFKINNHDIKKYMYIDKVENWYSLCKDWQKGIIAKFTFPL